MPRGQNFNINRGLEEVDSTFMDGFEGSRLQWRKNCRGGGNSKRTRFRNGA